MSMCRIVCVSSLLGMATLPGCAFDPDASPAPPAHAQRTLPAPGTMSFHMGGSVTSEISATR
jgi:hypothetical protein